MGIRTPDLLHAMQGKKLRHRRPESDTGRSGQWHCPSESDRVGVRLRALSLDWSLDNRPEDDRRQHSVPDGRRCDPEGASQRAVERFQLLTPPCARPAADSYRDCGLYGYEQPRIHPTMESRTGTVHPPSVAPTGPCGAFAA